MIAAGDHGQWGAMPRRRDGEIIAAIILPVRDFASGLRVTVSRRGQKREGATRHHLNNAHRVSRGGSDDALVPVAAASCGEAPSASAVKIDFRGFVEAT